MTSGSPVPQLRRAPPRQMLREAIDFVKSLPFDIAKRADAFEALAKQIEAHTAGAWNAARGLGVDGSVVFLGRQGEGLIVAVDGRLFRGSLGRGIDILSSGIQPNYSSLQALD